MFVSLTLIISAALKSVSKYHVGIQNFTFVRAEGRGTAGRLFYRRDWIDKDLREMTEFLGFVVRLEDGFWKVDCVINSVGTKISMGKNGIPQERTMNDLAEHTCLSLR